MDSHETVSTNHNLFELRERRAEAVSNRGPSAYQPNALPLGQTGSPRFSSISLSFIVSSYVIDRWVMKAFGKLGGGGEEWTSYVIDLSLSLGHESSWQI